MDRVISCWYGFRPSTITYPPPQNCSGTNCMQDTIYYNYVQQCMDSLQLVVGFAPLLPHRQTDTHTDRQTDRHTDRQTDTHTHTQTDTHTDRQLLPPIVCHSHNQLILVHPSAMPGTCFTDGWVVGWRKHLFSVGIQPVSFCVVSQRLYLSTS